MSLQACRGKDISQLLKHTTHNFTRSKVIVEKYIDCWIITVVTTNNKCISELFVKCFVGRKVISNQSNDIFHILSEQYCDEYIKLDSHQTRRNFPVPKMIIMGGLYFFFVIESKRGKYCNIIRITGRPSVKHNRYFVRYYLLNLLFNDVLQALEVTHDGRHGDGIVLDFSNWYFRSCGEWLQLVDYKFETDVYLGCLLLPKERRWSSFSSHRVGLRSRSLSNQKAECFVVIYMLWGAMPKEVCISRPNHFSLCTSLCKYPIVLLEPLHLNLYRTVFYESHFQVVASVEMCRVGSLVIILFSYIILRIIVVNVSRITIVIFRWKSLLRIVALLAWSVRFVLRPFLNYGLFSDRAHV